MNGNRERKSSQSRLFCNLAQIVEGFSHKNFPKCKKTAFAAIAIRVFDFFENARNDSHNRFQAARALGF